jgi:hypothetical protein
VDKVCANEVASGKSTEKGELTCHDGGGYDTSELLCILTRLCRVRALYTQHLQYGLLRR